MKPNVMKVLGIVLPLAGAGLSLATDWMEDKKLDEKVTEKLSEILTDSTEQRK